MVSARFPYYSAAAAAAIIYISYERNTPNHGGLLDAPEKDQMFRKRARNGFLCWLALAGRAAPSLYSTS